MEIGELGSNLAAAPIGFAMAQGKDLVYTVANARYLQMVSRTDIVGKAWIEVFPELVGSETHEAVRRVFEGASVEVEELSIPIRRPNGKIEEGVYSFVLYPTRSADGAVSGFMVIANDVTELVVRRREAEDLAAKLHEGEARYRALFESVDDALCLFEVLYDEAGVAYDYRFLEANRAFEAHTGLKEPIGKTIKELEPAIDESWFRIYGEVVRTGEAMRMENHDPALGRWFELTASRVGAPELHHVAVLFKDISLRRQRDENKAKMLAAEQAARREAENANRLKDEFLATVSHELRTPLNAMLGWVSLLRDGRVGPDKTATALETIERNARAQAQLIEDLLDVSRILEGKMRLDIDAIDPQVVIEAAIETVRPAANAKGVRLQATLSSGGIIMGDPHRLQQMVWNLLANAVKFTPRGGRVQIVVLQLDSSVEISVTDTGTGITPDFLPFVFDRFRQADGSSTRLQGGLGLGLAIVRHLTEMHGGTVSASSEGTGKGARFTIMLPLALSRRTDAAPPERVSQRLRAQGFACPPELAGLEVLAVDDEEDAREMVRVILETCGARVRVAASVAEAMQLLADRKPDVLLSDIGMPGEDGYALIAKVRALDAATGRHVPAVALTAYARSEDRTHSLLAGFSSHVPKPVEPVELLAVVASLARRVR